MSGMVTINELATHYAEHYGNDVRSHNELCVLRDRYVREREASVLDAAAATLALDAIFFSDQVDTSAITPQMAEAFELVTNKTVDELRNLSPSEAKGWLGLWKGKYFEVMVRDKLRAGEQVGDIRLEVGQTTELAASPIQPGWDLQILNADGTVNERLQLKATDDIGRVKQALERYPDIDVLATEEGVAQGIEGVLSSGISDADLEEQVAAPMEDLLDGPLEEFAETVLPGLPFVLIATAEGGKVMLGRQTFQRAMNRSLERVIKSGASIGVGALLALIDLGVVSLPATFLTRVSIDRYKLSTRISRQLEADMESIRAVARPKESLVSVGI